MFYILERPRNVCFVYTISRFRDLSSYLFHFGWQVSRGKRRLLPLDQHRREMKGKFRRLCEPKRNSGKIEVTEDIFKLYEAKGTSREKLFEAFIKVDGDKD